MTRGRGAGPGALYVARDNTVFAHAKLFGCGFSLSVPETTSRGQHVCLLLLLLHRRSHGAPGRAHSSPSHRAVLSLLGSFQCIGGPGLAQGIGRDHRRPHLGMRSAGIGHMQQVLMTTERYLFKRGNISDAHSLATIADGGLLSRCPNCYTYGLRKVTSRGKECSHCLWLEPSHADAAPVPSGRLPKLSPRYTPRPTVSDVSVEELRLALEQARAPFQQKYTKLPRRNRVDGAASRSPSPCTRFPRPAAKRTHPKSPCRGLQDAERHLLPPVAAKRAADRAAAEEAQRQAELAAYVPPRPLALQSLAAGAIYVVVTA